MEPGKHTQWTAGSSFTNSLGGYSLQCGSYESIRQSLIGQEAELGIECDSTGTSSGNRVGGIPT